MTSGAPRTCGRRPTRSCSVWTASTSSRRASASCRPTAGVRSPRPGDRGPLAGAALLQRRAGRARRGRPRRREGQRRRGRPPHPRHAAERDAVAVLAEWRAAERRLGRGPGRLRRGAGRPVGGRTSPARSTGDHHPDATRRQGLGPSPPGRGRPLGWPLTDTNGRPLRVGIQLPEVERDRPLARVRGDGPGGRGGRLRHPLARRPPAVSLRRTAPTRGPWEVWTMLAALAASTSRIRLGPLVAATAFHAPAMLAKLAATVDEISGGRLILGLGAGWNETEFTRLRLPVRPPDLALRGGVHDHPDAARATARSTSTASSSRRVTASSCRRRRGRAGRR